MERVEEVTHLEGNRFLVPHNYISNSGFFHADTLTVKGKEYTFGEIPGISNVEFTPGAHFYYHLVDGEDVSGKVVNAKLLFEILEKDSLTHEGDLIRVVVDENEARKVMDKSVEEIGNLSNPEKLKNYRVAENEYLDDYMQSFLDDGLPLESEEKLREERVQDICGEEHAPNMKIKF
ncbi:MAG: hypothetical protein U9Q06_02145 [Nanoarchaeota archaeon]|nr:hypothetical protein [Nanoarchaeota archaeon]